MSSLKGRLRDKDLGDSSIFGQWFQKHGKRVGQEDREEKTANKEFFGEQATSVGS